MYVSNINTVVIRLIDTNNKIISNSTPCSAELVESEELLIDASVEGVKPCSEQLSNHGSLRVATRAKRDD